jgi:hypothetical protein
MLTQTYEIRYAQVSVAHEGGMLNCHSSHVSCALRTYLVVYCSPYFRLLKKKSLSLHRGW